MSNRKPERTALKAETGGTIIADGAKIGGYDKAADASTGGRISLNQAQVDAPRETRDQNALEPWYKRPVGIVALMVIGGTIVTAIGAFFF